MVKNKQTDRFYTTNWVKWGVPIALVIIIKVFSRFPKWVESYYSIKIYPSIAHLQRVLFGWIPFSIGDIIYGVVNAYLLFIVIKLIVAIVKKKVAWNSFKELLLNVIRFSSWIYIVFNLFWGLNYDRQGIAAQLQLKNTTYTDDELKDLLCDVIDEMNATRMEMGDSNYVYPSEKELFGMAYDAYQSVNNTFPFITYKNLSVKPSLFTKLVSYAGYSGYYNPFSGEAQVTTDLPKFNMPFVVCHEMAHQLGYASESEANFVGYLAAIHSKNALFRYSALFEVFLTANAELLERDFWSGILNLKSLNPLVKRDRRIYREFVLGKQNNVEPIIKNVYDQYLKANQQSNGIRSYDELVDWLIDYRKKYGEL